jgi:hypothetical protein
MPQAAPRRRATQPSRDTTIKRRSGKRPVRASRKRGPKGRRLRGYLMEGDTVSRIELKDDDYPVVVWQARVKEDKALESFLQGQWTDARGNNPATGRESD